MSHIYLLHSVAENPHTQRLIVVLSQESFRLTSRAHESDALPRGYDCPTEPSSAPRALYFCQTVHPDQLWLGFSALPPFTLIAQNAGVSFSAWPGHLFTAPSDPSFLRIPLDRYTFKGGLFHLVRAGLLSWAPTLI